MNLQKRPSATSHSFEDFVLWVRPFSALLPVRERSQHGKNNVATN
jgi:hypothetical protein